MVKKNSVYTKVPIAAKPAQINEKNNAYGPDIKDLIVRLRKLEAKDPTWSAELVNILDQFQDSKRAA